MAVITVHNWSEFITAVGTSGAEVEFPHDSTYLRKTPDTSVDPSKLYVDANGIVQTNVHTDDLADLYENTFVLDANDYAPEGLTSTISITCASINGYGGTIKNLASSSPAVIGTYSYVSFTGIAFLNVRCTNTYFFVSERSGGWGTVSKCIFTGRMDGQSTSYFIWASLVHFRSCAFNIQLYGSSQFAQNNEGRYDWLDFNYCRINTEDHRTGSTYAYPYNIINSIWTGNYNGYIRVDMSTYDYTVFDLECPNISSNNSPSKNYAFVNTDKCASTDCVQVTTAELQSDVDLAAKGFPIQV